MSASGMVIIGAGECGVRAAFALKEEGYAGSVTLIGEESALPYERPPLSKGASVDPKLIADAHRYEEVGIDFMRGLKVDEIDPEERLVRTSDGATHRYEKLLLATGARPRLFPGVLFDHERVFSLRNHQDAVALRAWMVPGRKVAIVGGGFIGLELAATFRRSGADVTLIEALPRILMRGVPERLAALIHARHADEGVTMRCGIGIQSIGRLPDGVSIQLADSSSISADIVVIGIGAVPNTSLAEAAGLAVENGIVVDQSLRTSDPHIFAAGDCCNFPLPVYGGRRVRLESWRSAQDQGALAARTMLGGTDAVESVPWFWSDQYELTLQVAGLAEGAVETVERPLDETGLILFHLDSDGRLVSASGLGTGNSVARDIRLAEMLIATGARPDPTVLRDPSSKLKSLLRAG